jgi:hypothetical protein
MFRRQFKPAGKGLIWLTHPDEASYLFFVIFYDDGDIYEKAQNNFKGPMEVYDFDEDNWIYNKILLSEIFKGDNEESQRKILKEWISETIKNIL